MKEKEVCLVFKIDEYIKRKNISPRRLSEVSGVRHDTILELMSGNAKRYSRFDIARLCATLNCQFNDIVEIV